MDEEQMKVMEALQIEGQTNTGMIRSHNEDSIASDPTLGMVVLADGMGGYNAGEIASEIAVFVTKEETALFFQSGYPANLDVKTANERIIAFMDRSIRQANASIHNASIRQPQFAGMGTTIVMGLFYDNRIAIGHVGDSRMYRLREEELTLMTRDHSFLQEQIDGGVISAEDARFSKNKNLVTRAVGIDKEVEPEVHVYDVHIGDVYLLCSDGLNDMVDDEEIQSILYAMQSNLPLAVAQLIQMANDQGGRDNVSVILVKVIADFAESRSWVANLLTRFKK
jgi:protein phosphatase